MRTLVSVQKIVGTRPIEGADRIEVANVLGWQCVTQKSNNFKPGDLVAYFEIDSLIPLDVPQFEFLRKKEGETHARLKTIRLKGEISQGLILPLSIISEIRHGKNPAAESFFKEGDDLTEELGVTKWEQELAAHLRGQVVGQFPVFISKTDETRIQSCPSVLTKNVGLRCFSTEKLDGSSTTVFYVPRDTPGLPAKYLEKTEDEWIFGVCSRNLCVAKADDNAFWKAAEILDLESKLKAHGAPIALQGELVGPGVQNNKLQLKSLTVYWFNVADPVKREYYAFKEFKDTIAALGLQTVPILEEDFELNHTVDQLVVKSIGKSALNKDVWREGIVVRPHIERQERGLGRFSFKVINPEFLLKYNE